MKTTRIAISLIGRIRDHCARVYVLVANDGVYHVGAQAVCSCGKLHARHRNETSVDTAVQLAADDAFQHYCTTKHRLARPLVRASINDARGMRSDRRP